MEERKGVVYGIRCKANGRMYIGSSINFQDRVAVHFGELKKGAKGNMRYGGRLAPYAEWQSDYDKYGENGRDAFEVYVLEDNVPLSALRKHEQFWVNEYRTYDPKYGYNIRHVLKEPIKAIYDKPPKPREFSDPTSPAPKA